MSRILICDDDGKIVKRWAGTLQRLLRRSNIKFTIDQLSDPSEFWHEVSILESRRRKARSKTRRAARDSESRFDNADIIMVDYDLIKLSKNDHGSYVTGETVAYLCRCYSRCGVIVALNQFGKNPFDLTLRGHPESYADLNIGSDQLADAGLWSDGWKGFRPWNWPILPNACDAFRKRSKALLNRLDEKVVEYLGFPEDIAGLLPRAIAEFLGRRKKAQLVTFRDFVLDSGNGLQRKDKPLDDKAIARIAAARLWKWLERLVLPGEEILVDAPHLVSRFPSLLRGDSQKFETWNRTTSFNLNRVGLRTDKIEAFRFKKDNWLTRPAWFWKQLSGYEKIEEVRNPWGKRDVPELVFCEDVSCFLPRKFAREFVADLPSSFVRRYVVDESSTSGRRFKLQRVDYTPAVRFSL